MLDKTDPRPRARPDGGPVPGGVPAPPHRSLRRVVAAVWPWRYKAPLLLAAIVLVWAGGARMLFGPQVAAVVVARTELVHSVVASGHVEAPFRVNIGSQITGVVADVPVVEGQEVKSGDVLVVLDDREAKAAVVQAESVLAQAEARMRQLRELTLPSAQQSLKQAQATLVNAQSTYDRAKHLAETGSGTRATLDDATKALDIAKAGLRNAEFQVFTDSPGGSDYVMAETQLRQAAAALTTAQARLGYTLIKAPRDGLLISRDVEKGNVVQPTNVLMKLSPAGETQLVVQIDEKNLGMVKIGQAALASADAFPKQTFPAKVVYINPGVDLQRASVEVKLAVSDPPDYLRQDMTISVDIEVTRRPQALVVPVAAVHNQANGKPWVLKVSDGRAVRQPVKLGIVSGGRAEIAEGLHEGDVVLTALQPAVKAGQKVRPLMPDQTTAARS